MISGGVPESYRIALSDRLRQELFKTGEFNVVERNAMESILSEQGFQLSDCTTDECAVEVGRLLGVERMLAGSLAKIGQTHTINIRIIDVQSGKITAAESVDCSCPIDEVLTSSLRDVAVLIATGTVPESVQSAQTQPAFREPKPPKGKTRWAASRRSLIFPGSGQRYWGKKLKGWTYTIGGAVLFSATIVTSTNYNERIKEYEASRQSYLDARNTNDASILRKEMEEAYENVENTRETAVGMTTLFCLFHLWNVLDAALFPGQAYYEQQASRPVRAGPSLLADSAGDPAPGFGITLSFDSRKRGVK